jgi:hypothetical protein
MKAKLTKIYNSVSTFFWYAPKDLLNQKYFKEKEDRILNKKFNGFGISYTKPSTDKIEWKKRTRFFNNSYAEGNILKSVFQSILQPQNKQFYLKSGLIYEDFKITLNSVGNLIRTIKDLEVGKSSIHDIFYYKYTDNSYILINRCDKKLENEYKKKERELIAHVDKFSSNYEKKSASILYNK